MWQYVDYFETFPEFLLQYNFFKKSDYEKSAKYFNKNHHITGLNIGSGLILGDYIGVNLNGFGKPRLKIYLKNKELKETYKLLKNNFEVS